MQYILQEMSSTEKNTGICVNVYSKPLKYLIFTYIWFSFCNTKMQQYTLFRKFHLKCMQKILHFDKNYPSTPSLPQHLSISL